MATARQTLQTDRTAEMGTVGATAHTMGMGHMVGAGTSGGAGRSGNGGGAGDHDRH